MDKKGLEDQKNKSKLERARKAEQNTWKYLVERSGSIGCIQNRNYTAHKLFL